MERVKVNGIELAAEVRGPETGPALVFTNSLGTNFTIWDDVLPKLASGLRIIRYDQRGHGRSNVPKAPYSIDDHVADLVGLLDHLAAKTIALVGLSIGGQIGQRLASRHPNRLKALILMDTASKIGTAELWNARIEAVRARGMEPIADQVMERWFSPSFRTSRPADVAQWRAMLAAMPAEGHVGSCTALRDADLTPDAKAIRIPTRVLCGSEDLATPPDLVRATANLIPGAEFAMIDGAGHLPCIEAPAVVAEHINDFLKE